MNVRRLACCLLKVIIPPRPRFSNLGTLLANPDVTIIFNVHHAFQLQLGPGKRRTCFRKKVVKEEKFNLSLTCRANDSLIV